MSHAEAVEQSIWLQERPDRGEPLTGPLDVDVAIVGGGITGLTAAALIASDGKRVAVLEAHAVGAGTSGANSAHVSAVPDAGYRAVARRCGIASGREYVARLNAALELMDSLVEAERIGCDWARVPAFWFSERGDDLERLRDEARAADELGQECHIVADVPLPWPVAGGLQFPRQARFHPMRYLSGLARVARARGAALYEAAPALAWKETATGVTLHTPRAEVRAGALILATHTPIGFNILQTELTPAQSYMLVLSLPDPLADALFWDTADPYHYLRPLAFDGQTLALVGGADHKTGQERHPQSRYGQLTEYCRQHLPSATVKGWWSAQLYDPADGMPYIGRSPFSRHVYVAAGFAGVGLVQGTMAAAELAALLRGEGRDMPWKATRLSLAAAPRLLANGIDMAAHWVGDRVAPGEEQSVEGIGNGEGRILRIDGHRRAVYRDESGRLHVLSPACTHLGCLVRWNQSARTWDCPCHGTRYAASGEVLEGPALKALARIPSSEGDTYAGVPTTTSEADAQRFDTDKG